MRLPAVLVTGATGKQGGAVARELLSRGHRVRALTREPGAAAAAALAGAGAEIAAGAPEDSRAVERAAHGLDAAFLVTVPYQGAAFEVDQGLAAIAGLSRAGVQHVVYASAAHADRDTGVPSNDSKRAIEAELRARDLPHTIVAPVYFMENLETPASLAALRQGRLLRFIPAERPLQLVSVADVGRFVAEVVAGREVMLGQRIDVAADELDGLGMAAMLARRLGRPVRCDARSPDELPTEGELGRNVQALLRWLAREGFSVDIARLHRRHPQGGWLRFADWLAARPWATAA